MTEFCETGTNLSHFSELLSKLLPLSSLFIALQLRIIMMYITWSNITLQAVLFVL